MASTFTIQDTINWAQPFMGYAPLAIGVGNEPAITSANTILQTILSPPFKWRWNRTTSPQSIPQNSSTLVASLSNFGWLEKVTVGGFDCQLKNEPLSSSTEPGRPSFFATNLDNDAGQITFGFLPTADQTYPATLIYQEAAPLITALTSTWAPIPDYLSYIYNWGFLALMLESVDSARAMNARRIFVASLLGIAEGLKDQDRSLFLSTWLGPEIAAAAEMQRTTLGEQARGF